MISLIIPKINYYDWLDNLSDNSPNPYRATPLKNMKVSWDDDIPFPTEWNNKTCSKPPTKWFTQIIPITNGHFWEASIRMSEHMAQNI